MEEIKELEEAVNKAEERINYMEKLKEEIQELYNRCWLCGKSPITNHSIEGGHKPPYIPLCKKCHRHIENLKETIKIMTKENNLTMTRFNSLINTFENGEKVKK